MATRVLRSTFLRPRFSLRALLIVTTLLAIGAGFVGRALHRSALQRRVAERLIGSGGYVIYRGFIPVVDYVELYGPAGDAQASELPKLEDVTSVTLGGVGFTDVGATYLARLPRLPRLRKLSLQRTALFPRGIHVLSNCPSLESIDLGSEDSRESNLARLVSCRTLRRLEVTSPTDNELRALGMLTQLRSLDLGYCRRVSSDGFAALGELKNLEVLSLSGESLSDEMLSTIGGLTKLRRLDISYAKMQDAGLRHLASLTNLTSLELKDIPLTDRGWQSLRRIRNLQYFGFYRRGVTDTQLLELAQCPSLRHVYLGANFGLTESAIATFRAALPGCQLEAELPCQSPTQVLIPGKFGNRAYRGGNSHSPRESAAYRRPKPAGAMRLTAGILSPRSPSPPVFSCLQTGCYLECKAGLDALVASPRLLSM